MKLPNLPIPSITLPLIDVKTDPLDALLYGLGLRLSWLDKHHDDKFTKLTNNKNIAIVFKSNTMARYYRFYDGHFGQASGEPKEADLTVVFQNSLLGATLLAKGDLASLMTAIQDGKVQITGDYKLMMWFSGLAKHAITIPPQYEPYVEKAKPYFNKVRGLFSK